MSKNFLEKNSGKGGKSSENLRVSGCPFRWKQVHTYKSKRAEIWVCKLGGLEETIGRECPRHGNLKLEKCSVIKEFFGLKKSEGEG